MNTPDVTAMSGTGPLMIFHVIVDLPVVMEGFCFCFAVWFIYIWSEDESSDK